MDRKGLVINTEKTKIVRFRKRGGRGRKQRWWKGKEIEEAREVNFLGYKFKRSGGQETQVEERVKKTMGVMGQVWGIGRRRGDWGKRLKLFDWLVVSLGRRYGSLMGGMGESGKHSGEVYEVGIGSGWKDT